jgi:HD superfamily phosphohydrolase YqeK
MNIPTLAMAEALLTEAAQLNPGPWEAHSRHVARAAEAIADRHPNLDAKSAYVVGLLHDIGRREGVTGMRHVYDGYTYLAAMGFDDAARICLTHSFASGNVMAIFGKWDCTDEELAVVEAHIEGIVYDEYDRLIQLCDSLAMATGICLMEKRMMDVALRYGTNEYTVDKWRATFALMGHFETAIGSSIYSLFPKVVENTFGRPAG